MTDLEILVAAREVISVPERWTRGRFGRDLGGLGISPRSSDAVCWCAVGAIRKVAPPNSTGNFEYLIPPSYCEGQGLICFNDAVGRTHAEVLTVFDRIIADLQKEAIA